METALVSAGLPLRDTLGVAGEDGGREAIQQAVMSGPVGAALRRQRGQVRVADGGRGRETP